MNAALIVLAVTGAAPDAVLYDFTAKWCGPCRGMEPTIHKLTAEGFPIRQVDVDQRPDLKAKYKIGAIPAFVLIVNGQEVARRVGTATESDLRRMLARVPKVPDIASGRSQVADVRPDGRARTRADIVRDFARNRPPAGRQNSTSQPSRNLFPPVRLASNESSGGLGGGTSMPPVFGAAVESGSTANDRRSSSPQRRLPTSSGQVVRGQSDDSVSAPSLLAKNPLQTTVRIRVKDKDGVNFGSGTIVQSTPGRAIALTCGHIFRGFHDGSEIEVDVFRGSEHKTLAGNVIYFDAEDADVGLISIPIPVSVPVSKVAPLSAHPKPKAIAFSFGCDNGDNPTRRQHRVTRINPYRGADTIECTGTPVKGRSGGGLFDAEGRLVGICIAADSPRDRGVYAGLREIHKLLDKEQMSALYKTGPSRGNDFAANSGGSLETGTQNSRLAELLAEAESADAAPRVPSSRSESSLTSGRGVGGINGEELGAAMSAGEGAEIVCIIKPKNSPGAEPQIVVINRASPKFLQFLRGELPRTANNSGERDAFRTGPENSRATSRQMGTDESSDSPFDQFVTKPSLEAGGPDPTSARIERYVRSADSREEYSTSSSKYDESVIR
ncbi:trypsin-like peptidase domain-containing protein [Stratiformator vulcanicus]|uniref:Thioredoxin n=1 Tax=Stratiformator vulcanicus TaxID=2527980 RepID=A0A517R516_9PLAN|nr:thioredoxin domain-containing protein [Stratiformator vulcanicus]QDT38962.1 Thioredoxin [Stratiformator vulcanicus]